MKYDPLDRSISRYVRQRSTTTYHYINNRETEIKTKYNEQMCNTYAQQRRGQIPQRVVPIVTLKEKAEKRARLAARKMG